MRARIGRLGLLALALGLAGCDSGFSARCLIVTDSDVCFDGTPWDGDASASEDVADAGPVDAGAGMDAATPDAALPDAALPGSVATRFCQQQFATALAFRERCSGCVAAGAQARVDAFIQEVLLFSALADCERAFDQQVTVTRFEPGMAAACAQRFDAQFELPTTFTHCNSAEGLALNQLAAVVGKGAQYLAQIPECRATFVGSTPFRTRCTTSLQCVEGLRCLPMVGGASGERTCQGARTAGEACTSNADCNDGLVCSGHADPGRTCIDAKVLRPSTSACVLSYECAFNEFCGNGQCTPADGETVCRQ